MFSLSLRVNGVTESTLACCAGGPGSNPESLQIKNLIVNLNKFIKDFQIKSILDMPCGDFVWMKKIPSPLA